MFSWPFFGQPISGEDTEGFPSVDHTLSKEAVIEEFREAGYKLTQDKDFLQYQYYLEFELWRIGTTYILY